MLASWNKLKSSLVDKLSTKSHNSPNNIDNNSDSVVGGESKIEKINSNNNITTTQITNESDINNNSQESQASPTLPQFPFPSCPSEISLPPPTTTTSSLPREHNSLSLPPLEVTPVTDHYFTLYPPPPVVNILQQPISLSSRTTGRRKRVRNTIQFPLTKIPPTVCQPPPPSSPEVGCSNTVKSICNGFKNKHQLDMTNNTVNRFEELLDHFTILQPLLYSHPSSMVYSVIKKSTLQVNTARIFKKSSSYESNLEYRKRLQKEIYITSQLEHSNILKLLDVCFHFNLPFIISEGGYFDGTGLLKLFPLPLTTSLSLIGDLLEGLLYLHTVKKVVHLDLSLENVVIFHDGTLKLSNFSHATMLSLTDNLPPLEFIYSKSTSSYSSPELINNRLEVTDMFGCDIWSSGILSSLLLTGTKPWDLADIDNDSSYLYYVTTNEFILTLNDPSATPYLKLISNMLDINVGTRYTINQVIDFYWYLQKPENVLLGELATVYM